LSAGLDGENRAPLLPTWDGAETVLVFSVRAFFAAGSDGGGRVLLLPLQEVFFIVGPCIILYMKSSTLAIFP